MFCNNQDLVQPWFYFAKMAMRKSKQFPILSHDNGSNDETWDELRKLNADYSCGFLENKGIAAGRNHIINVAKIPYPSGFKNIILVDSDLFIIRHNSFLAMENTMKDTGAGVVFGKQMSFDPAREGFEWKQDGYSFCLISGETFDKYGLFDEQFENYYDDTDFHMRLKANNVKMAVCEQALGVHMWGMTTTLGSEGYRRGQLLESDKRKFKNKWENQNGL